MRFVGLVIVIIVVGFIIGFIILNSQETVNMDIFGHQITGAYLYIVCLISFAAGVIFVFIFAIVNEISLRTQLYRLRKQNKHIEKELTALRNLPFEEEK
jgi:uncharacterized integral membrane protein